MLGVPEIVGAMLVANEDEDEDEDEDEEFVLLPTAMLNAASERLTLPSLTPITMFA